MRVFHTVALLLAVSLLAPAAAAAQPQAIGVTDNRVVSLGAWTFGERGTLDEAAAVFGQPTSTDPAGASCVARWAPIGLRVSFVNLGSEDSACGEFGAVQAVLLKGAGTWATPRGLALGDPSARLRELYPRAKRNRFKRRQIDLHRARLPGLEPTSATVGATVSGGRVSSFSLYVGSAGE